MDNQVREIIDNVLQDFQTPESLDRIALHIIPPTDRPCGKWSFLNRWIVRVTKSDDARGMKQWMAVERRVTKGAKAVFILAPLFVMNKKVDKNTGEQKEGKILIGFKRIPVYRIEDTNGKPVEYPGTTPTTTPPLLGVAKAWGLDVKYAPILQDYGAAGWFTDDGHIVLGSHDPHIFFHELAHAAHQKVGGKKLQSGSDPKQEVIAEFAAAILMRMYGYKGAGNAYDYIQQYAGFTDKKDVIRACTTVLSTTERVVKAILATEMGEEPDAA